MLFADGLMQPCSDSAASVKASGLRRNFRARLVMGGASLFLSVLVQVGGGGLIAVVHLGGVDDGGVAAADDDHVELIADRGGLAIGVQSAAAAHATAGPLRA